MFYDHSIIAMLVISVVAALGCLRLPRPDQILRLTLGISAIELALAANIWIGVISDGFVTAADEWFYVDAFSAFHLIVLTLVFLFSSTFAGVYFPNESSEHAFTLPVARRFGAL